MTTAAAAREPVRLYAAGSLRAVLEEVGAQFTAETGANRVAGTYGPPGLLRDRIDKGEKTEVFASANMEHSASLARSGKAGPVALFTRNQLCALTRPEVSVQPHSVLDRMLDPAVRRSRPTASGSSTASTSR